MPRGIAGWGQATRRSLERGRMSGFAQERRWWAAAAARGRRTLPQWPGRFTNAELYVFPPIPQKTRKGWGTGRFLFKWSET